MDELGDGQSPSPILASDVYSAGCVMYEVSVSFAIHTQFFD
jgi:hypothetical protein